ncbi:MAG: phage integrase N-terminal domain-containing protein [Pseudomonadota bacterium]
MDAKNGAVHSGYARLIIELNKLLLQHAKTRVNGDVASGKTVKTMGQVLRTCFNNLWELGYKLLMPANITNTHITALCESWHAKGIANATIQARLSGLRIMCRWVGKGNMVKSVYEYLPHIERTILMPIKTAQSSKSWCAHGVDIMEKIKQADRCDMHFGLMIRMELAFGLRRMEVLQLKPFKSDLGTRLRIYEAKNGRLRDIDIETPEQRQVLDMVKANMKSKLSPMGWQQTARGKIATLEYNESRYHKCMAAIGITREKTGVTGHGLRAQYAENAALIARMIPPTLGGTGGQMDKGDLDVKRAQVSEKLGHSRISVTGAYYGSFGRNVLPDAVDRCRKNIESGLAFCQSWERKPVPKERIEDCMSLVIELEKIGVDTSLRQVHMLWEIHSRERHAHAWITPGEGMVEMIEVVALNMIKEKEME